MSNMSKSITELHEMLKSGAVTSEELVKNAFLLRKTRRSDI